MVRVEDLRPFTKVRLKLKDGSILEGYVLPKPETSSPDVVILKLPNGYNVGIRVSRIESVEVLLFFVVAMLL